MEYEQRVAVGLINLMPDTIGYHRELAEALSCVTSRMDLHWLRLETKRYSADAEPFVMQQYRSLASVKSTVQLDGLIVTGAPVELMEFSQVNYWDELRGILQTAITEGCSTLGICWGALAVGQVLGLGKTLLEAKVSGVFPLTNVADRASPVACMPPTWQLPFSIQAHLDTNQVQQQVREGKLAVAATLPALPHAFVHTRDNRHFMCLGHPEYAPARLIAEWQRDLKKNPATLPPQGLDLDNPQARWRPVADQLFTRWVEVIAARRALRHVAHPSSRALNQVEGLAT